MRHRAKFDDEPIQDRVPLRRITTIVAGQNFVAYSHLRSESIGQLCKSILVADAHQQRGILLATAFNSLQTRATSKEVVGDTSGYSDGFPTIVRSSVDR